MMYDLHEYRKVTYNSGYGELFPEAVLLKNGKIKASRRYDGGGVVFGGSKKGWANSRRKVTRGVSWVALVLI
ncbi:hypothetical protein LR48_Vigan04g089800 [Vigna angularis]|uniref:Uncharacterized protein n=1 Tax=Phaseolus angularis TaxID=3914 RepID=A0A0L9UCP2_PHAAN|nr:hypothetical protein LR48_Vigan04g089800 [Vigna angularis]